MIETTLQIRHIGKGRIVANAKPNQGLKTREHYVIEACGGKWVHRHEGYVLSDTKEATLRKLCELGWHGTSGIAGPQRLIHPKDTSQHFSFTYLQAKKELAADFV